jgi:hypothetical protein
MQLAVSGDSELRYRCYLIAVTGRIHRSVEIEADSDEHALEQGQKELQKAATNYIAVEVWERARFLGRIDR